MTDDIVTRLRAYEYMRDGKTYLTMAEAADVIETLRSDVKDLQKIIQLVKEADDD